MPEFDNSNRGVLFRNDRKESERHPDFKGNGSAPYACSECGHNGQQLIDIGSWTQEAKSTGNKYQSLKFNLPRQREDSEGDNQ